MLNEEDVKELSKRLGRGATMAIGTCQQAKHRMMTATVTLEFYYQRNDGIFHWLV